MFRYESRHQPLISRRAFLRRMLLSLSAAAILTLATILIGAIGYHATEELGWRQSLLNSVLIITGNGPPFEPRTAAGQIFTMIFAVLGVCVYVAVLAALLVPAFHRMLHHFHLDTGTNE